MLGKPQYSDFHQVGAVPRERLLGKGYGAVPNGPTRKRLNGPGLACAIFGPWLLFSLIVTLTSLEVHDSKPEIVYFCLGLALFVPVLFLARLVHLKYYTKDDEYSHEEPTWLAFMSGSILLASILGFGLGFLNYKTYMDLYAAYTNLASYSDVDPSMSQGGAFMDAGAIVFTNDTHIDHQRSIGFKDEHLYCIAPITAGDRRLASYEFWAVGIDCCSGFPGGFACYDQSHHDNMRDLRAARRWIQPEGPQRYFELALSQAEREFGFTSKHPVFMIWEEDPQTAIAMYWWNGFHVCLACIFIHLLVQTVLACIVLRHFAKKSSRSS